MNTNGSGWPCAYCLICGIDEPDEICIASGCECPCHDELWRKYNEEMKDDK